MKVAVCRSLSKIILLHLSRVFPFISVLFLFVTEHEKTEADRDREEELLSEILKMVTERSNIVDKMDEDRLRYVVLTHSPLKMLTSSLTQNFFRL